MTRKLPKKLKKDCKRLQEIRESKKTPLSKLWDKLKAGILWILAAISAALGL